MVQVRLLHQTDYEVTDQAVHLNGVSHTIRWAVRDLEYAGHVLSTGFHDIPSRPVGHQTSTSCIHMYEAYVLIHGSKNIQIAERIGPIGSINLLGRPMSGEHSAHPERCITR